MDTALKEYIRQLAARYETEAFLPADPSVFMHRVSGADNQEATAFVASCLSYGSRKQFFPKIQYVLDVSGGDVDAWVRSGAFAADVPSAVTCYYRLYTCADMHRMLTAYRQLMHDHGSMKRYVQAHATTGIEAVGAICRYFASHGDGKVVPKNTASACKRVCMFLRWMVRSASPVDLGLWADIIDRRTLIMPLDTHVLQEAARLGLMSSRTASMSAAQKLTRVMAEVFPDDPLRADFALFGLGVDESADKAAMAAK